jgi:hypothetical protein
MAELDILSIFLVLLGSGSFFGSIFVVYMQYQLQKRQVLQETLREERRRIYFDVLNPFFMLFSKPPKLSEAVELMQTTTYRKMVFELTIIGSDEVVKAYTKLMQFSYKNDKSKAMDVSNEKRVKEMLFLIGNLLITMRKDLGDENTKLNEFEMFEHMISDIEKIEQY